MDPQVIVSAIDAARDKLEYLAQRRHAVVDDCEVQQRLGEEYAERASRETYVRAEEARESLVTAKALVHTCEQTVNDCYQQIERAKQILVVAQEQQAKAKSTLAFWQVQLAKASAWAEKASQAVRIAEQNVNKAAQHVSYCRHELESAEAALRRAQHTTRREYVGNDRQGNPQYRDVPIDTTSYIAAVSAARDRLSNALAKLHEEERRLDLARQDLQKALDQKAGAQRAETDCQAACACAVNSTTHGQNAANTAERAKDDAQRASKEARQAELITEQEVEECKAALKSASRAQEHILQSRQHLVSVLNSSELSFDKTRTGDRVMDDRKACLLAFNMPGLAL